MAEGKQRKPKQSRNVSKDDLVLGILEGKNGTPLKAASQNAPKKMTSTVRHPWGYGVVAIQGETVTSTLNVPN